MKATRRRKTTTTTLLFCLLLLAQAPASALITDTAVYSAMQQRRAELSTKESNLLKSKDSLEKRIDELKRINDNNAQGTSLDHLTKQLDGTYMDLRKTQLDLQEVDRALI
ncbi:MAG: hypothetical protein K8F91_08895 [Candidatus Obscuribacterales bacterium]|nr:hypothetical protein [Candidatus Obscuribacterales bacterium]